MDLYEKVCTKCGLTKFIGSFHKDRLGKLGVRAECKDCRALVSQTYFRKNRDAQLQKNRAYYKANRSRLREQQSRYYQTYYQENKAELIQKCDDRRRGVRQRTLGLSCAERIQEIARSGFSVDHIIPIKGALVSGLHVPYNLQPLPAYENSRKRNAFNNSIYQEWRANGEVGPYIP